MKQVYVSIIFKLDGLTGCEVFGPINDDYDQAIAIAGMELMGYMVDSRVKDCIYSIVDVTVYEE